MLPLPRSCTAFLNIRYYFSSPLPPSFFSSSRIYFRAVKLRTRSKTLIVHGTYVPSHRYRWNRHVLHNYVALFYHPEKNKFKKKSITLYMYTWNYCEERSAMLYYLSLFFLKWLFAHKITCMWYLPSERGMNYLCWKTNQNNGSSSSLTFLSARLIENYVSDFPRNFLTLLRYKGLHFHMSV